jgi:hypothetical protein
MAAVPLEGRPRRKMGFQVVPKPKKKGSRK